MDSFSKRSLSDTSSEEDDGGKKRPVILPKKRKWIDSENEPSISKAAPSSSDEDERKASFSPHPKKRIKTHADNWNMPSMQPILSQKSVVTSSSSNEDDLDVVEDLPSSGSPKKSMPMIRIAGTKRKPPEGVFNDVAAKMMAKMGYKAGTGLGKHSQGRTEIIEASTQRGRRGLGLRLQGLEPCDIKWDFSKEHVSVDEEVQWLPSCTLEPPSMTELRRWAKEGEKKLVISDEVDFCDPSVLKNMLSCKDVFDQLEPEEMRKARTKSNPFETIRGVFFQNRAAVKMANIDAVFDFMFSNPKDENGHPSVGSQELLYFADICAGPGGFSEYVLWRKKWRCKGFGFTLRGSNDFKLEEFFAGPPESFEPHYGVNGLEGDGNIYIPENLRVFKRFVLENTDNLGVHFVMADGGFSVEGQENLQEILSKRLYLCQFLCALSILRTGGHFVCKVFDLFTPFSVGLLYLLYRAFKNVCIHKPNTSRPANSERYIICKWKRDETETIHDYMFEVNCRLGELSNSKTEDVIEVVPLHMLKEDTAFYEYIVESNNTMGEWQVISLAKIRAFTQDSELAEHRQKDIRRECLEKWQVPDKMRSSPCRPDPFAQFKVLLGNPLPNYLSNLAEKLDDARLSSIASIYDYRCLVSAVEKDNRIERGFFLGLGRSHVFRWDGALGSRWTKVDLCLELPADTLVYAEIVQELKGEGKAQRKISALHIIDALFLGGEDVQNKHFTERLTLSQLLVKAISKPSRPDYTPVRVKEVYRLEEAKKIFNRMEMKTVKGSGNQTRLCYQMDNERHFLPTGLLLIKAEEDPWTIAFSRKNNRKYHFNTRTRESSYKCPEKAIANFKSTFSKRLFWAWEPGVQLLDCHKANEGKIHRHTFTDFIAKKLES